MITPSIPRPLRRGGSEKLRLESRIALTSMSKNKFEYERWAPSIKLNMSSFSFVELRQYSESINSVEREKRKRTARRRPRGPWGAVVRSRREPLQT